MKLRTLFTAAAASLITATVVALAQVPGVNSPLQAVFNLVYDNGTMKPTYSATQATFIPASAATDICILNGSATKTVKVRRISFNMQATTAVTIPVAIIKRSAANTSTGGTPFTPTVVPYDSQNSLTGSASNAGTAVMLAYWTNPTVGTAVGTITDPYFSVGNLTTGGAAAFPSTLLFGQQGSPIVLRGVAQGVAVNLNGSTNSGNVASCTFEWTEE